jgi:hypothetical protein
LRFLRHSNSHFAIAVDFFANSAIIHKILVSLSASFSRREFGQWNSKSTDDYIQEEQTNFNALRIPMETIQDPSGRKFHETFLHLRILKYV